MVVLTTRRITPLIIYRAGSGEGTLKIKDPRLLVRPLCGHQERRPGDWKDGPRSSLVPTGGFQELIRALLVKKGNKPMSRVMDQFLVGFRVSDPQF